MAGWQKGNHPTLAASRPSERPTRTMASRKRTREDITASADVVVPSSGAGAGLSVPDDAGADSDSTIDLTREAEELLDE